ncbi:DUF2267 domain-containing protein [Chitinispirillales bacterium ANBcel5]|uniref:DUF2267 domain-containing protein n=1 Tax=Cellulosispirillum alkaliphilum TaxID=3039283 RepID=UPI002A4E4D6B|nr:DUF2267 domain-containing protein [Chitinispirillales bacterium ANBcel5]
MNYQAIKQRVLDLDFVADEEAADSMIKAVLGTLASRMKTEQAHRFSNDLPEPLSYEKLRGHQTNVTNISLEQFVSGICTQFKLTTEQAQSLIRSVLHFAKDGIPHEEIEVWEQGLPTEWAKVVENS